MITITDPHGRRLELHGDWQGQPRGSLIYDAAEGIPGGVPIRGEKTHRWGTGTVPDRVTRDGRTMTIGGWAHFGRGRADLVLAAADRLTGMWADNTTLGELAIDLPGYWRSMQVQPDSAASEWPQLDMSRRHLGWLHWGLALYAPDPHAYGKLTEVLLQPVGTGIGLDYPLFTRDGVLTYGGAVAAQVTLTNAGNAVAYPVVEVDVTDASGFRLVIDGRAVEYNAACVQGAPVTVDMRGRVTVGGVDQSGRVSAREWAGVPAGGSVLAELHTLQGGAGHAWATVRDTYI